MSFLKHLGFFNLVRVLIFLGGVFVLNNCVSVKLASTNQQRSTTSEFIPPRSPYKEIQSPYLDRTWKNPNNNTTISYLSDCNNPTDPTLNNILRGLANAIEDVHILDSHKSPYNDRESLRAHLVGRVDGVRTQLKVLIFKKNYCTYILNYAAREDQFAQGEKDFDFFVENFKVP